MKSKRIENSQFVYDAIVDDLETWIIFPILKQVLIGSYSVSYKRVAWLTIVPFNQCLSSGDLLSFLSYVAQAGLHS